MTLYRRKVDRNQLKIVTLLRDLGFQVTPMHTVGRGIPDLLISCQGRWHVAEVKFGRHWALTTAQDKFHAEAKGPIPIFETEAQVIAWAKQVRREAK